MKRLLRKVKALATLPMETWQLFVTCLPGPIGINLRRRFWKKRLGFLGKSVRIDVNVYFQNPQFIVIGDNCWIDRNVAILAGGPGSERITFVKSNSGYKGKAGEVTIGKNTHIAPNCVLSGIAGIHIGQNCGIAANSSIYSFSHHYRNLADRDDTYQYSFTPMARLDQQAMILGAVVIEDFCAVGLHSVILPGSTLMRGTWIASGSIVSGKHPQQTLVFHNRHSAKKNLGHLKIRD